MGQNDIQDRLLSGERIVWAGQPTTGLLFTARDLMLVPFSLLWGGFAVFWEYGVINTVKGAPVFFELWGIPFVLAGLYLIFGRFFVDAYIRANTLYAVTNRRVLIFRGGLFQKFSTMAIDRLPELSLDERKDGRGTIRFQAGSPFWNNRGWSSWTPALDTTAFYAIPDARSVFNTIQKTSAGGGSTF